MTDIEERLREHARNLRGPDYQQAADEIERLRAALADLRERSVEEGIHHFVTRIDAALTETVQ